MRIGLRILYWLAVIAASLAILVGLVLFLEARDNSAVDGAALPQFSLPSSGSTSDRDDGA